MDQDEEDYADDGRPTPTVGSLAVAFAVAFAAVLGPLLALMAFVAWSGLW